MTPEQMATIALLSTKMSELGLNVEMTPPITEGPIVTVYRFTPKGLTTVSKLEALSKDFAMILGAEDVLVKRMPGETSVSIFVPNKERSKLYWRNGVGKPTVKALCEEQKVPLYLGVDIVGREVVEDLSSMPHILIAGSTGGGKSTLLSSVIATLIFYKSPDEVRFVLSDTKQVEFGHFIGAKQLLYEPATNVYRTLEYLDWCIAEMEGRLKQYARYSVKNISDYNAIKEKAPHPYIVIVIDELADLLLDTRKKGSEEDSRRGPSIGKISEGKLSQLASKARATGIHIIAATQRTSVDVINGTTKANFPARLSFRMPSQTDSRTVLDTGGAENLLSKGDMLFVSPSKAGIQRVHSTLATVEDVKACVELSERSRVYDR